MSLEKSIRSGQDRRQGYRARGKPGEWDKTCRPHGGGTSIPCPWCERARLLKGRSNNEFTALLMREGRD